MRPLKPRAELEENKMKKRWMKSIIETSKTEAPSLPFNRAQKMARTYAPLAIVKNLKTA